MIMTIKIVKTFRASFKVSPDIKKQKKYRLKSFVDPSKYRK